MKNQEKHGEALSVIWVWIVGLSGIVLLFNQENPLCLFLGLSLSVCAWIAAIVLAISEKIQVQMRVTG